MRTLTTLLALALALSASAQAPVQAPKPADNPSAQQPLAQPAAPEAVKIEKMELGTAVKDHEIIGVAESFDASVGRLYCWMRIKAENVPTTIKHVWYRDGKKVAEVPLTTKVHRARLWSNKTITAGAWKVEAVDEAGQVLRTVEAAVSPAAEQPGAKPEAGQPAPEKKPEQPKK